MEIILDIDVKTTDAFELKGGAADIVMIQFSGTACGNYFKGDIIGCGVDTQRRDKKGTTYLSARYMLDGTDCTGEKCRIFIENNTNSSGGLTPVIITDSKALAYWENSELSAEIFPAEGGVNVKIYLLTVRETEGLIG